MSCARGSSVKGTGDVIRVSAPYTSGWGSFVPLKWTASGLHKEAV